MRTTIAASEPIQSVPVTVDTKGRVRTSKEQRCGILAVFERSGVSAAEFAKQNGIKYSTFAGWLQRHRRTKPKGQPPIMRLLEAVVEQTEGSAVSPVSMVVLRLRGGAQIELADPKQIPLVTALLRALAQPC